ncbi:PocR ligand-binding domain-containing protein [Micropruina sonneratiae]|uniref:PocR ligand-binding domain-containing protein n=1 Tax=Micropruina sonneratiae TaxID=2986940 RepID=UPI002225F090|nr:PocR ligand-binding domain-containing protein [Micropruina sp. KQZ13P-5]MCW3157278.1 PocR ligand-binding domain-containing protein [Micropruina sp. KQZ13P-5]
MAQRGMGAALDLEHLEQVLEDFSEATGLATVAVDPRGTPVTQTVAFTDFCRLTRSDPVRSRMCHGCDAHGGLQSMIEGSPVVYRCHSGLVDFGVPITDGDSYVGAILCGQVRVPETEQPDFLSHGSSWRGDRQLTVLYDQVPTLSRRKIRAAATTLLGLAAGIDGVRHRSVTVLPIPARPPVRQTRLLSIVAEPAIAPAPAAEPEAALPRLREALGAEDLATAYGLVSRRLDAAYRDPAGVAEALVELEDGLLGVARELTPRLAPHLTGVVQRHRDRRTASTNRYQVQLYLERTLGMILDEVMRSHPARRRDLRDLLNTIARHPNRALSLTEAAAATHFSPGHLSKLFKSVTGYTFVSYVTAWRIARARLLLACTETPVQRIAADLDFKQVNYFSRVFRAHTGMSPSEYRRQCSARDGRPADVPLPTHDHTALRA